MQVHVQNYRINQKKVLIVFGTRPEAIKMAPVIKELSLKFHVVVCVTAQHRHLLDQVLDLFEIKPDHDLNIMRPKQDLFDLTINILGKFKNVLIKNKPDLVIVHGDTTSAMAASLASFSDLTNSGSNPFSFKKSKAISLK